MDFHKVTYTIKKNMSQGKKKTFISFGIIQILKIIINQKFYFHSLTLLFSESLKSTNFTLFISHLTAPSLNLPFLSPSILPLQLFLSLASTFLLLPFLHLHQPSFLSFKLCYYRKTFVYPGHVPVIVGCVMVRWRRRQRRRRWRRRWKMNTRKEGSNRG